jgi:antitoxin component YwqK of YwqJK toxin-antitoxin module
MDTSKEKARQIISGLFNLEDPVSKSLEERREFFDFREFYEHDQNELLEAFESIRNEAPSHAPDLFQFNLEVVKQHRYFIDSSLVWEKIGTPKEPILLNILFDETRERGQLQVSTVRIADLQGMLEQDPQNRWGLHYLPILESFERPIVYILYTDDEMSKKHGFPFDIAIELHLPSYLDGSNIADLFIKCLNNGYNTLDSYQLLKIDTEKLDYIFNQMLESKHFSEKQLHFISTVLQTKKILPEILEGAVTGFSEKDKTRYTEIVFDSNNRSQIVIRNFSENGLLHGEQNKTSNRIFNSLAEKALEYCGNGDHLVRFFNKTYMLTYNQPMWVPFLLKGGELTYPKN